MEPVPPENAPGAPAPAAEAVRYPCPSCGADRRYDPASGDLRCPFCGGEKDIEDERSVVERDLGEALAKAAREKPWEAAPGARRVECRACGASVELPPTQKAGLCPYCGSPQVVEEAPGPGRIPPDCLVPFTVDGSATEVLFRKWIRSLWFRPNALRSRTALADVRGVMVPYWTFDAEADSSWTAEAGYHYHVTVGSGKSQRMEQRTRWEPAAGRRHDSFDDVLVCGSRGLDAALLGKIEPFDLSCLVAYRDEYLAGWAAEVSARDVGGAWSEAEAGIRGTQESRCAGDVPGDTHRGLAVRTRIEGRSYKHCLLPVWVAAYRYRGKVYRFMVNGQTGEVQGEAPLSWVKILLLVVGVLAGIGAIVALANR